MMKILLYDIKEKFNRFYIYSIYLIQFAVLIVYLQLVTDTSNFLQTFQASQRSSLLVFSCILFLSYEIFCDFQKTGWRDIVCLKKYGWIKIALAKNIHVFFCVAIEFIVVVRIEVCKLMLSGLSDLLQSNVSRVLVLNFFLLPIMGMMLGETFALACKKRWSGYLGILVIIMLGGGLLERVNSSLFLTTGFNMDQIFHLFRFEQPNDTWRADYLYLVPAETYRFFLVGTWIAGCIAILSWLCIRKWSVRSGVTVVFVILCGAFAFQVVNAGNYVDYGLNNGSATSKNVEFEKDELHTEKNADFTVKECRMELRIQDELDADVELVLGEENISDYRFTLYRGYVLTDVTDEEGNALSYEREYDYITIHSEKKISEIHMSYHGYQQSFYSNQQAVMLPGYFAYYPQTGFRQVFLNQWVDDYLYYGFNMSDDDLQEIDYQIHVEYAGDVCSNLSREGDSFVGCTAVPTLMGGAVSEEKRTTGHYVYPSLIDVSEVSLSDIKRSLKSYCELLGMDSKRYQQLENVIVVPASVYIGDSWGQNMSVGDCLFIGDAWALNIDSDEFALEILKQDMNVQGEKSLLRDVFFAVMDDSLYLHDIDPMSVEDFFAVSYDEEDSESEEMMSVLENFSIDRMYLTLMEKFDETEILQATAQYLLDPDATDNFAEFMQKLYRELEEQ